MTICGAGYHNEVIMGVFRLTIPKAVAKGYSGVLLVVGAKDSVIEFINPV